MLRYFVLLAAAAAVAGCAGGARVSEMTVPPPAGAVAQAGSLLYQSTEIGAVAGGERTNPLWTSQVNNPEFQEALRQSLAAAGMWATANPKFRLSAQLVKLDQPWIGFDYTVKSHVRYTVVEVASGRQVFDRTIDAQYTATVKDAFMGVERLRLANEGSIRANIAALIDALAKEGPGFGSGAPTSRIDLGRVTVVLTQ